MELQGWNLKDSCLSSEGSGAGLLSLWAVFLKRTSVLRAARVHGWNSYSANISMLSKPGLSKGCLTSLCPSAPLSIRELACTAVNGDAGTEPCLFKFQRALQGMWEWMGMLIKEVSYLGVWFIPEHLMPIIQAGDLTPGYKAPHRALALHPFQTHQAGSSSYLCPTCLTWESLSAC